MDEELAECLLMWVQTFDVVAERDSVQALSGGQALSEILHEVSPVFFNEEWMSSINTDAVSTNKHLKMSNLKKVLKAVISFYNSELGLIIQENKKPNLKSIVEANSLVEMGRLLQLVLGCAVNCENKQDYIQAIMGMEESVQHGVMTAIQELMTQDNSAASQEADTDLATQLQTALRQLSEAKQSNSELAERCRELDLQVASLLEERAHAEPETNERHEQHDDIEDPETASGKKFLALQQQLEQYKDEVYRLDAAKEDYRMKYEFSAKEVTELSAKNASLSDLADEARSLKDEVDILRQNEEKVKKFESTIESYKRKLEDMTDLKRTVRMLEEKNTSYMEKSVEWEEESKKTSALKSQIEVYKRQVQELQTKTGTETKRADKSEFEVKRLQEKMAAALKEKDMLTHELSMLRETNEELQFSKLQGLSTESGPAHPLTGSPAGVSIFSEINDVRSVVDSDDDLELLSLPPALKEKYIRLQTENKMLKTKMGEAGDNSTMQSMLEDSQSRVQELETESRLSNQRVMELEAQIEDLQEATQRTDGDAERENKKKMAELTQKYKQVEAELAKQSQYITTADGRIAELMKEVGEKNEKLSKRENEMKEQEEKYKKYLEKAKNVINKMETQNGDASSPQLEAMRAQLLEKEKMVAQIQKESERQKSIREQEEKLMVSAWYNMGMSLHRKSVEDRLKEYSTGQSFLARQRQVHNSKRSGASVPPANR